MSGSKPIGFCRRITSLLGFPLIWLSTFISFDGQIALGQQVDGVDLRQPAMHPDNQVIRRQKADLQRLKKQGDVLQRYQEMLAGNQSRTEPTRNQSFPSSYSIDSTGKKYVRRKLPPRLIPPNPSQPSKNPYKLKQSPAKSFSSPHKRDAPTENFRTWNEGQAQPSYPPIVDPPQATMSIRQPVFYGRTGHQQQMRKTDLNRSVIRGSSPIPVDNTNDRSRVTRARILLNQDSVDPFGQVPERGRGPQDGEVQEDDPFADPQSLKDFVDQDDPFNQPPADLDPQNANQDPFADPPQDMTPKDPLQDPFESKSNIQNVDPFPQTPNDIPPSSKFIIPEEPVVDSPEPDKKQNEAPKIDPTKEQVPEKPYRTGPYKNSNFSPSPIRPAPPRRDFDQFWQTEQQFSQQVPDESYGPSEYEYREPVDQPSLMRNGFRKHELYEGIPSQNLVAECEYCEPAYSGDVTEHFPRPRLIDRWLPRGLNGIGIRETFSGNYDGRLLAESQYKDLCTTCNPSQSADIWVEGCTDCGFEPLYYVSVIGGYSQHESSDLLIDENSSANTGLLEFNDGFGIGGALGQIQGQNLRMELEVLYRGNKLDRFVNSGFTAGNLTGSIRSVSGMANIYWDFASISNFFNVQPYIGGGLGFAVFDTNLNLNGSSVHSFGVGRDSSFAYQLMAGLTRPISHRVDGFVEYRYFSADSFPLDLDIAGTELQGDLFSESDNIFFGIRMHY